MEVCTATMDADPARTQAPPDLDALLLRRYLDHADREAIGELFQRNADSAFGAALRFLRNPPDVFKYKDGVLMTREERPLPSHQWGRMDYDPDRKVLWHTSGGMLSTLPHAPKNLKQEGDPGKLKGKGPLLWKYALKTNKWSMVLTEDPTGCTLKNGIETRNIRYCPPLRKLLMLPNHVGPNEARENFKAYDPDNKATLIFRGTYNGMNGETWVYRYKRAAK